MPTNVSFTLTRKHLGLRLISPRTVRQLSWNETYTEIVAAPPTGQQRTRKKKRKKKTEKRIRHPWQASVGLSVRAATVKDKCFYCTIGIG